MTFTKTCSRCGEVKPRDEFYSYVTRRRGQQKPATSSGCKVCMRESARLWRIENRERKNANVRAWNAKNKHRVRAYELKKKYGLTQDEFDALLTKQGKRCAICRTDSPGGKGTWHVDHCHETKAVRGILCHGCNTGLGCLGESVERLEQAIGYLLRMH